MPRRHIQTVKAHIISRTRLIYISTIYWVCKRLSVIVMANDQTTEIEHIASGCRCPPMLQNLYLMTRLKSFHDTPGSQYQYECCLFKRKMIEKWFVKNCVKSSARRNGGALDVEYIRALEHTQNTVITKTRLFQYIENFTTKNWKFSDKNSDIFQKTIYLFKQK